MRFLFVNSFKEKDCNNTIKQSTSLIVKQPIVNNEKQKFCCSSRPIYRRKRDLLRIGVDDVSRFSMLSSNAQIPDTNKIPE